jgi:putative heme transporter
MTTGLERTHAGPRERNVADRRRRHRRLVALTLTIVAVGVTFAFLLPRIADYRDVWGIVRTLSWWQLLLLAAATTCNLATFAPPWMVALPGLGFRHALVLTQASTASTYLAPGGAAPGMAVSYAILRTWRFSATAVALAVAVTGLWNQLAIFGFPVAGLGLLTLEGDRNDALRTVGAVGLAAFVAVVAGVALALYSARTAQKIGDLVALGISRLRRLVHRRPVEWTGMSLVRFRDATLDLLRHRWHLLTLATLAGQLTVFLVLYTCLRVLGVSAGEATGIEAFAAWSLARLLGSLPLTPGGVGIVELGLTGLLIGFGGHQNEVVAAVLVYRFLTIVPTIALGLVAAALWRRHHPALATPM